MSEHIGGKSIGGHSVAAIGPQQKLFDVLSIDGEVHAVDLVISGALISAGAGTPLVTNPTGAAKKSRGLDDVDALMDFIYNTISLRLDEKVYLFQNELASRWRTIASFLTGRDAVVTGSLVDGVQLNATGGAVKPFTLRLPIPLSVRDELFEMDGDSFKQGSERVKKGGFFANLKNIGGALTFQNGGAGGVVLSALAVDIDMHVDKSGDKFYAGPTYQFLTHPTQPAEIAETALPRAKRHFLLVDSVAGGPYTLKQQGDIETDTRTAASFVDAFNRNRRRAGGDNSCARAVPLMWPRRGLTLAETDLTPRKFYLKDTAGNQMDLMAVTHQPLDTQVANRLEGDARVSNKGQPVATARPTPPSAAHLGGVQVQNTSILGQHIVKTQK